MTTESSVSTRRSSLVPGVRVVARAAALTALAGVALVVVAAVAHGGEAAAAAAVGAGLVILVVSFGTLSLHVVASAMPTASLLVALVTYVTQLAIVLLVFLAITRGDTFSSDQARGWLAAAMVLATLVWTAAHLVLTARERAPYFDLPPGGES
jgi:ATP synthase protein I